MKPRSFKLIKSYPNSENVGSVYEQGDFMGRPVYFKAASLIVLNISLVSLFITFLC